MLRVPHVIEELFNPPPHCSLFYLFYFFTIFPVHLWVFSPVSSCAVCWTVQWRVTASPIWWACSYGISLSCWGNVVGYPARFARMYCCIELLLPMYGTSLSGASDIIVPKHAYSGTTLYCITIWTATSGIQTWVIRIDTCVNIVPYTQPLHHHG